MRHCVVHPADEKLDKRFMFDIHAIEKGAASDKLTVFTFQAMTDEDLEGWVSVMEGQINIVRPPTSARTEMQSKDEKKSSVRFLFIVVQTDELDEVGIDFVKKCIHVVERRGLHEQGLYRMVGMQSKVNSLVSAHFGKIFLSHDDRRKLNVCGKILSLQIIIERRHRNWLRPLMKRWI